MDAISAGRIDARNVRRVVRAIEVFEHTGTPISTWQTRGKPDFEYLLYGIEVEPAALHARIEQRVDAMLAAGFVEEVRALIASGVSAELPAMSSIGYREVAYLTGGMTLDEARERILYATRQLARRQRQWFRRDDPRVHWLLRRQRHRARSEHLHRRLHQRHPRRTAPDATTFERQSIAACG